MTFPIGHVRAQFPSLATKDGGVARIYLDNPAGTQVPASVAEAIAETILHGNANLGGYFLTTQAAGRTVDDAHLAMSDFLGARGPHEIIIGPNMTSLTYQISRSIGRTLSPGDEIIVTRMDHEGDVSPWLQLAEDRQLVIRWLEFDEESWQVEPEALNALLGPKTKLLAITYSSNLTGAINDIAALTSLAKEAGALVFVDAVQFAPHGFVDVAALGCDFLACSSYKFFGPHLGILWARSDVLDTLPAYKCRCSSDALPERFETGTPQIELQAGLTATVNYFSELGCHINGLESAAPGSARRDAVRTAFEASMAYESGLALSLIEGLSAIPGVRIRGITNSNRIAWRVPTVSFTVDGLKPDDIVRSMNDDNVFVWAGHNYALEVVRQLGIPEDEGVVRVGIAHYNTSEEITQALESAERAIAAAR